MQLVLFNRKYIVRPLLPPLSGEASPPQAGFPALPAIPSGSGIAMPAETPIHPVSHSAIPEIPSENPASAAL
jgi:hypothetical protein